MVAAVWQSSAQLPLVAQLEDLVFHHSLVELVLEFQVFFKQYFICLKGISLYGIYSKN